jgi:hypothetical protein
MKKPIRDAGSHQSKANLLAFSLADEPESKGWYGRLLFKTDIGGTRHGD